MRPNPVVGQQLFSLNVGNSARNVVQKLTPVTVTKVGRKYFECGRMAYRLGDWRQVTDYTPDSELYESEQAWKDAMEKERIEAELSRLFRGYGPIPLSLTDLRRIREICKDHLKP